MKPGLLATKFSQIQDNFLLLMICDLDPNAEMLLKFKKLIL